MGNVNLIIVPDIHARNFWREPVKKAIETDNTKIIFLGDYVDPYFDEFYDPDEDKWIIEGINSWDDLSNHAIKTLEDIIKLKKEYPDKVILLLGNHDCSYMIGKHICDCRREHFKYSKILTSLFNDNRFSFKLAHEEYINDKHYIFSHAGIGEKYASKCFGYSVNEKNVVSLFNQAFKEDNYGILESLGLVSFYRGGWRASYGSLVWADAREWLENNEKSYGISIVGHTKVKEPIINEQFAFLDCKKCFLISQNNKIKTFE